MTSESAAQPPAALEELYPVHAAGTPPVAPVEYYPYRTVEPEECPAGAASVGPGSAAPGRAQPVEDPQTLAADHSGRIQKKWESVAAVVAPEPIRVVVVVARGDMPVELLWAIEMKL